MIEYEFRTIMENGRYIKQIKLTPDGEWINFISTDQDKEIKEDRCSETLDMFPNDGDVK